MLPKCIIVHNLIRRFEIPIKIWTDLTNCAKKVVAIECQSRDYSTKVVYSLWP